jgi:hypothetical protein
MSESSIREAQKNGSPDVIRQAASNGEILSRLFATAGDSAGQSLELAHVSLLKMTLFQKMQDANDLVAASSRMKESLRLIPLRYAHLEFSARRKH